MKKMKFPASILAALAAGVLLPGGAALAQPVISNVFPDGSYQFQAASALTFNVNSAVNLTNISVSLNGTKFTTGETFLKVLTPASGLDVTLPATSVSVSAPLSSNVVYKAVITASDANGAVTTFTVTNFDTLMPAYTFEAEDWDYTSNGISGLFFDNPQTNAYAGLATTGGVDAYNTDGNSGYRPAGTADQPGGLATEDGANNNDTKRVQYIGSGKTDYDVGWTGGGDWANYTRHYPAGSYYLYIRASGNQGGADRANVSVSAGTAVIGGTAGSSPFTFTIPNTGDWQKYAWAPLIDSGGARAVLTFDGSPSTLRIASDNGGYNVNFYMLIPTNANAALPGSATVSDSYPNGAVQFQYTNKFAFTINSPVGVNAGDIIVQLNATSLLGTNTQQILTAGNGLDVSGSPTSWTVSCALNTNTSYTAFIQITDVNGGASSTNIVFDTVYPNYYTFEAEDFNYQAGQFIDNPQTNAYLTYDGSFDGVSGIDFVNNYSASSGAYGARLGLPNEQCGDVPRVQYASGAINPVSEDIYRDYDVNNTRVGSWANYTRTFPAGVYNIYLRVANNNAANSGATVSLVTGDRTQPNQTTTVLGSFAVPSTGGWTKYTWVVLRNAAGYPVQFNGGGVKTLRVTENASDAFNANYYMLVPADTSAQVPPFVTDFQPDGSRLLQMTNQAVFTANSMVGISLSGVSVILNGVDVSSHLVSLGGDANALQVGIPLEANKLNTAIITLTDSFGSKTFTNKFDTFDPNAMVLEAEDYDYTSGGLPGQFFDFGSPAGAYNGLGSTLDVDEHDDNHAGGSYRAFPPGLEIEDAGDLPRPAYDGTGLTDHNTGFNDGGNWANYTRTYPAGVYNVYMRAACPGTIPGISANVATLSRVTGGWGTTAQTTTQLGSFNAPHTGAGAWHTFDWAPLVDAGGNLARITLSGTNTLRASVASGGYNANFYIVVPADLTVPTVEGISPDGSTFFQSAGALTFTANSAAGIDTNNIVVTLNGVAATNLVFTGTSTRWNVTAPLQSNSVYTAVITVTTLDGKTVSSTVKFDTFNPANYQLEAEDYDYGGGHFFDGQVGAYLGLAGMSNIDYVEADPNGVNGSFVYRPVGIPAGTGDVGTSGNRPQFGAGKTNYNIGYFGGGSWVNFTRNYPGGTYNVYARCAEGAAATEATLSVLTSGYGTTNQTASPLGTFFIPLTAWNSWVWTPLLDGNGNPAKVSFDGAQTTLKLAGVNGFQEVNVDFLMLCPTTPAPVLKTAISSGNLGISFYTQSGYKYQLQYKDNLTDANWTPVGSPVTGNDAIQSVPDPTSGSAGQRFYRVEITATP
jgi:hypothetical protein